MNLYKQYLLRYRIADMKLSHSRIYLYMNSDGIRLTVT